MADYEEETEETSEDGAQEPVALEMRQLQEAWLEKIEQAEKDNKSFEEEAKRAIKWLRLDETSRSRKANGDKLNLAYANYEVLRSTIYSKPPHIVVQPMFGGGDNRQFLNDISEVVERAVETQNMRSGLHEVLRGVRDELLKVGRGVPWVRYEADFQEVPAQIEGMPPTEIKTDERVCYDVVSWRDFLTGKAERWIDVPWIARRTRLTKSKFKKHFAGLDDAQIEALGITFSKDSETNKDQPKNVNGAVATVYEVWCKTTRKVYFVAKGAMSLIEAPSDPLIDVSGFYPCPCPAMSLTRDGTLTPIPDVVFVEDQLIAIDAIAARITALQKAIKVRGFYAKGATDGTAAGAIEAAVISEDDRMVLVPVSSWAANGQSKLDIIWLPIEQVIAALNELHMEQEKLIQLVYQITGISDVMRGASQASETLGAQQLNDRWGGVRVKDKQEEMRRVARDLCCIASEVVCEIFDPESIAKSATYGFTPDMIDFLRDDKMRSLMLDVETDSTIQADEQEEKSKRTEFTTVIGQLIQQMLPVVQQVPEMVDFAGALIKFNVRGFRAGRELEKEVDNMLMAVKQKIEQGQAQKQAMQETQQSQPPPPNPAMVKIETDAKLAARGQDIKAQLEARGQNLKHSAAVAQHMPVLVS
jgi:hypothetical protein